MACPIGADEIQKLKIFVQFCSMQPSILNRPELEFFKTFVESLGGKVPPPEPAPKAEPKAEEKKEEPKRTAAPPPPPEVDSEDDEDDEPPLPEPEIDREGCVDPDPETPHEMGDTSKEPTEDDIDQANELRSKAQAMYSEQKFDEAIDLYTQVSRKVLRLIHMLSDYVWTMITDVWGINLVAVYVYSE